MSDYSVHGDTSEHIRARLESPEVRASLRAIGVPAAVAAERLREAAQHFDLAAFDAQLAACRPKAWKRLNRRPSRVRAALRRLTRR